METVMGGLRWFYGIFGASYPIPSLIAVMILWALAGGFIWKSIGNEYEKAKQEKPVGNSEQAPTVASQPPSVTINQPNGPVSVGGIAANVVNVNPTINHFDAKRPWGLSDDKLGLLTQRLAPLAPNTSIPNIVVSIMGDPDSQKFAKALDRAFRDAGWKVGETMIPQVVFENIPEGVYIKARTPQSRPPGLTELMKTLHENGISLGFMPTPESPEDKFQIVVGSRPPSE